MTKKRILLKIGSNTLTKETDQISRGKIEDIGRQIAKLKDDYEFIIVSSGAIAAAKQFVKLEHNGEEINVKQALAAIGQPHLMRIFQENFRELGLFTSQCLLSYSDFEKPESQKNITAETITAVSNINDLKSEISLEKSSHGTGGMHSKIQAATIAQQASIETWVINGLKDNFIIDALKGASSHTKILT